MATLPTKVQLAHALLKEVNRKAGLYFITHNPISTLTSHPNKQVLVKIGIAGTRGSLSKRLDSYLLYWPTGFTVLKVFFTHNKKQARAIEKAVHGYLNCKHSITNTFHSHDEEWFELSLNDVNIMADLIHLGFCPLGWDNRLFPFKSELDIGKLVNNQKEPYVFIGANKNIGLHRVKSMDLDIKQQLESYAKKKRMKKLIQTGTPQVKRHRKQYTQPTPKKLIF